MLAAAGVCPGQTYNLGPHDINGQGCVACHVVSRDSAGNAQYSWAQPPANLADHPDESWRHSAMCISCHDSVMAQVMDLNNVPASQPNPFGPHPVNVLYKVAGGALFPVKLAGSEWQLTNNRENPFTKLKLFPRSATDPAPTVQCESCHDPHDHTNAYFLRDPYDRRSLGTRLCRTCHKEQSEFAYIP